MRMMLALATWCGVVGAASAHVSDATGAQHAAEHAWLALLLLPVGGYGPRLLRRRLRD